MIDPTRTLEELQRCPGEYRRLEAVDPWPCVAITWSDGSIERVGPRWPSGANAFERRVQSTFAALTARGEQLDRGWLDAPQVPWEPADGLPFAAGDGAFRASAMGLARRPTCALFDRWVAWLATSTERPLDDVPRRAALTERFLFIERFGGRVFRVPLDALRTQYRAPSADVFVFGRRTRLVLPDGAPCAVRRGLEDHVHGRVGSDALYAPH